MFEANCSKQMGQHMKAMFRQMFTRGLTKVRVSDADRSLSCWSVMFVVEGDQTDNEGQF